MKEEVLNIICGELSTQNFSIQHPEIAKEWFVKALRKYHGKDKVTKEWIEKKARELREINIESEKGSLSLVFLTQPQAEDFIRSLIEETGGK